MSLAALMKKGGLRALATATVATTATAPPPEPSPVATVATVSVATAQQSAANDPRESSAPDPDRYCWPHSTAMNAAEIDRFLARLEGLHRKGLCLDMAETLADAMVMRDRDGDDRRSCFECQHFSHRRKTCGNFNAAGVGPELGDMAVRLQRCPGFHAE